LANENRVRGNLTSGTLNGALTNVATSMTAANLANLPVVGATQHAVIVIENELVYVTAHTGGATTATILRGQEGTTAAAHNNGVAWVHAPVVSDFDSVLGYAQVNLANQSGITTVTDLTNLSVSVTVPYAGHRIKITAETEVQSTIANDTARLQIQEGATVLQISDLTNPAANVTGKMIAHAIIVPTAGAHTYKLTLQRVLGTGSLTNNNGVAGLVSFILVEDLGPSL
jgi:hypothetical protein